MLLLLLLVRSELFQNSWMQGSNTVNTSFPVSLPISLPLSIPLCILPCWFHPPATFLPVVAQQVQAYAILTKRNPDPVTETTVRIHRLAWLSNVPATEWGIESDGHSLWRVGPQEMPQGCYYKESKCIWAEKRNRRLLD